MAAAKFLRVLISEKDKNSSSSIYSSIKKTPKEKRITDMNFLNVLIVILFVKIDTKTKM